jgi:hypothetical protein
MQTEGSFFLFGCFAERENAKEKGNPYRLSGSGPSPDYRNSTSDQVTSETDAILQPLLDTTKTTLALIPEPMRKRN